MGRSGKSLREIFLVTSGRFLENSEGLRDSKENIFELKKILAK